MFVYCDGEKKETSASKLGDFLIEAGLSENGIPKPGEAVAVNDEIIVRASCKDFEIHDGDRIDMYSMIQGG